MSFDGWKEVNMGTTENFKFFQDESLTLWNILFHKNNYFLSSWAYKYCKMCLLNGNRSKVENYLSGAHWASYMIDLKHMEIMKYPIVERNLLGSDV